jgi:DNA-binding NtrC family response regulator
VRPPRIARATFAALRAHDWPGNVRELRNVIEVLCLLREGKVARPRDLPEVVRQALANPEPQASLTDGGDALEVPLNRPLDETIQRILDAALALEGGNRSRAARRLGISLRTMQRHAARGPGPSGLPNRREPDHERQEAPEGKDHEGEKRPVRRAVGDGFRHPH